jgi:hypothetical protein
MVRNAEALARGTGRLPMTYSRFYPPTGGCCSHGNIVDGTSSIRSKQIIFLTFFEAGFWAWFSGPGRWGFLAGREVLGLRGRVGRAG